MKYGPFRKEVLHAGHGPRLRRTWNISTGLKLIIGRGDSVIWAPSRTIAKARAISSRQGNDHYEAEESHRRRHGKLHVAQWTETTTFGN